MFNVQPCASGVSRDHARLGQPQLGGDERALAHDLAQCREGRRGAGEIGARATAPRSGTRR